MKVYLLAAALSLAPAAALAQFASGFNFTSYTLDAGEAEAVIAAANQAIQQCTQKLRGRNLETVCTVQTPEPAKTK